MKIAVVSSGHFPSRWAHSVAVAKNANGFAQLGHDVELLTVERLYEKQARDRIASSTAYYGIDDSIQVHHFRDRAPFYFQDIKPVGLVLDGLTYLTAGWLRRLADPERRIAEHCASTQVDVCYCRSYRAVEYAIDRGIPTVMESHSPRIRKPSLKRVVRKSTSPNFRTLVTISDRLKENYVKMGVPEYKVVVYQDGVDLEQFMEAPAQREAREELGFPLDQDIVMYLGSLHPDKGIEQVLKVAAQLTNRRFQIVGGSDEEVSRWRRTAERLGAGNVEFSGHVENWWVPTYLSAADVLIMPYDTEREVRLMDLASTSPLKLFEYLAAARPIVTTDIPAISRTVDHGENALLAPPNDIEALADCVLRSLENEALASRLSRKGYETAEQYTWQDRCERILKDAGLTQ